MALSIPMCHSNVLIDSSVIFLRINALFSDQFSDSDIFQIGIYFCDQDFLHKSILQRAWTDWISAIGLLISVLFIFTQITNNKQ